jgi:hypothetical protein
MKVHYHVRTRNWGLVSGPCQTGLKRSDWQAWRYWRQGGLAGADGAIAATRRERPAQFAVTGVYWLPVCKISGGKVLSSHIEKTTNRLTIQLRLAAATVGRTNTALGAFYRRLSARIDAAKAVTATVRKIAVMFYNALRYGMTYQDRGAKHYEQQYHDQ